MMCWKKEEQGLLEWKFVDGQGKVDLWIQVYVVVGSNLSVVSMVGFGNDFDYLFKIFLVGNLGVGKSSFFFWFIVSKFDDLLLIIGVDFKVKMVSL